MSLGVELNGLDEIDVRALRVRDLPGVEGIVEGGLPRVALRESDVLNDPRVDLRKVDVLNVGVWSRSPMALRKRSTMTSASKVAPRKWPDMSTFSSAAYSTFLSETSRKQSPMTSMSRAASHM